MALLTTEQSQTRFLAIILPTLTLCTHALLALSSILPGSDPYSASFSLGYNVLATSASVLGLIGAIRLLPSFVSAYTLVHTTTLSFATIALVNAPFSYRLMNPVIPSWQIDENAICRDIDAGFGWDEDWLVKCSRSFSFVKSSVACLGLLLMIAQWWALMTVRRWGKDIRFQRRVERLEAEEGGVLCKGNALAADEKNEY